MGEVSTIGLDIAKLVFQVHGVDADGAVVMRKRVGRARSGCTVVGLGKEATTRIASRRPLFQPIDRSS